MPLSESTPSEQASSQDASTDGDTSETIEVPARYAREMQARERLHEQCPVDVYVAGINPRYSWPYRLVAANEARQCVADSAETVIVDSVVTDPYYPVEKVLDAAHKIDADYVVGKDWPPAFDPDDMGGLPPGEALHHFMSRYRRHECDADVIVPVFPPFDADTLRWVRDDWIDYYALGGMRDLSGERQVAHIRQFREVVGYDVAAHGLGVGTSVELVSAIRASVERNPERPLLDSLDISTPENAVSKNKLPDKRWHQQRTALPTGEDSTTMRAGFAEAIARMLEYELSPGCDDDMLEDAGFGGF